MRQQLNRATDVLGVVSFLPGDRKQQQTGVCVCVL